MTNKIIFIGLIVALLQVASAEEANPEPYMSDAPLTIYVDAGKEIDQFLSLAKSIDGKQSVLDYTLERMSAEIKATEERCTQKVSKLERKLEDLINLQTNSSKVATLHKRPAELACEETHYLRVFGNPYINNRQYEVYFRNHDGDRRICDGVLIEKRFMLTTESCLHPTYFTYITFELAEEVISRDIVKVHSVLRDLITSIVLIELDSDVDYTYNLYQTCLYTSELNSNSALIHARGKIQIAEDSKCLMGYDKNPYSPVICVYAPKTDCRDPYPVYVVEEERKSQLFGFVDMDCEHDYHKLIKVFPYLDFIENIVWPKNGN